MPAQPIKLRNLTLTLAIPLTLTLNFALSLCRHVSIGASVVYAGIAGRRVKEVSGFMKGLQAHGSRS